MVPFTSLGDVRTVDMDELEPAIVIENYSHVQFNVLERALSFCFTIGKNLLLKKKKNGKNLLLKYNIDM